jgi:predicted phage terminase large subunit-like protein
MSEQIELSQEALDKLRYKAKNSLFFLARAILGFKELDVNIHKPICVALQNYTKNNRMMVVLPRSWFKSSIASIAYPIWRAINNPNVRILIAQNSMTNAKKKIFAIKQIFEGNDLFRALFPDLLPGKDTPWSAECLVVRRTLNDPEGTFEPAGTGTAVTSRHYDVIIEDDTVAPDFDQMTGDIQQPTTLEIEKSIGWHKMCHPLLLHPTRSQILVVGTRWAEEDLIGWIMKKSPGYKIMTRSAFERPGCIGEPLDEDLGGIAIWERFNSAVLSELRSSLGDFMFSLLYLNIASSSLNIIFKREYFRYYEKLPENLLFCTSVDPAPSDSNSSNTDSDYSVVLTTALNPNTSTVYIVYYDRVRTDPGGLIDKIFYHYNAYKPVMVKVESVAYQRTLNYWIRKRQESENNRFYIDEVKKVSNSKAARILALQPWFAANRVYMKAEHSSLERELLAFNPLKSTSAHDDIIDALAMQADFWSKNIEINNVSDEKADGVDEFSGKYIVDELLGRVEAANKYPYDIGNMSERIRANQKREYFQYN